MIYHYFVTIDKVFGNTSPTSVDFGEILEYLYGKYGLKDFFPYPVKCQEYKEKGSLRKKTKVYNWPHYHAILSSDILIRDIHKKPYYKKYSIRILHLVSYEDIIRTAGYIQKRMIDEVQNPLVTKTVTPCLFKFRDIFNEYAFED